MNFKSNIKKQFWALFENGYLVVLEDTVFALVILASKQQKHH